MAFFVKNKQDIIQRAIAKLQNDTPITAISPGTMARTLIDLLAEELGDFYSILDFNSSMSYVSTARGNALESIASLFGVARRNLTSIEQVAASTGTFYFFTESPVGSNITIPSGTKVYSNASSFVGRQLSYRTTSPVTITTGQSRVFAPIEPIGADGLYSVGKHTLTEHDFTGAVAVHCTNPKPINAQVTLESDEDFRARVVQEVRRLSTSNELAIRFQALRLDSVRDVKVRSRGFGLGTVDVLVVPVDTEIINSVVEQVTREVNIVKAAGIEAIIRGPSILPVDLNMGLVLQPFSRAPSSTLVNRVKNGVRIFMNSLSIGDSLYYNQLISNIINSHPDIIDVVIQSITINNRPIVRANFYPSEEEMLVAGDIDVAVNG